MLDHLTRYYIYKSHPILNTFSNVLTDNVLKDIFKSHFGFIYPKIIYFSFTEIPKSFSNLDDHTEIDVELNDDILDPKSDDELLNHITTNEFRAIIDCLVDYCKDNEFFPIFIIDLRNLRRVFDEGAFLSILQDLQKLKIEKLIIATQSLKKYLEIDICKELCRTYYTYDDLVKGVSVITDIDTNIFTIELPKNINLSSLEELFSSFNIKEQVINKFIIKLNFSKVEDISYFALYNIILSMQTISKELGIQWSISQDTLNRKIFNRLKSCRIFDIDNSILIQKTDDKTLDVITDNFGLYAFDEYHANKILLKLKDYMSNLRLRYKYYLDNQIQIKDKYFENRSYKDYKPKSFISNVIRRILFELIDNVNLHSEGTGYVAIVADNALLYVYIGDTGIGLKDGILKNYQLSSEIKDDNDALTKVFNLSKFADKRIKKYSFEGGSGYGLSDTLNLIFSLKGKIIFRTGTTIGAFMNPVSKTFQAPKITKSSLYLNGTQYMIIIPLATGIESNLPRSIEDFMLN